MTITETTFKTVFLGSCADPSLGIGYLIRGESCRRSTNGWELRTFDGEWIQVYDIVRLIPSEPGMTPIHIQWVEPAPIR